jgi:DNA-dependent RNA polymerase auxiliary subunit epsilon
MTWYAVTRRYTVEDAVYIEAESKTEARRKVRDVEYEYMTDPQPVSDATLPRARPMAFEDLPEELQWFLKYGEYPSY